MNFYERVKELCEIRNLTIPQMCEKAGISFSIIYDIKSGRKHDVSRKSAEKIAAALEMTVSDLYNEKSPDAEAPRASEHIDFIELLDTLPEEEQKKVYEYLQLLSDKHKHR